jgi:Na+-transporting NADH:ubiquinone oxidoreductase subunit C
MGKQLYIILFMVLAAAIFGSGVTGIYLISKRTLERNNELRAQRALVDVFGLGDAVEMSAEQIAELVQRRIDDAETRTDPGTGWTFHLLKAYADDQRQRLLAYGFRFRGLGFWAPIEGMLAVTPDLSETVGLVILEHKETPGLGGRIEEPAFTRQFREGVRIFPPGPDGACLIVSSTEPADPEARTHHVDAITGATQTSLAMERILNEFLERFGRAMKDVSDAES